MLISRIIIQVILTFVLVYLVYRILRLEYRVTKLENFSVENDVDSTTSTHVSEVENRNQVESTLIQPSHFESPVKKSKLKKLTLNELSCIAEEQNITTKDSEGRSLKKADIIEKIVTSSNQ